MKCVIRCVAVLLIAASILPGCKNSGTAATDRYDSGVLYISCDESFKPVIDAQISVYQAEYPHTKIVAHYKPEAECFKDLAVDSIRMIIATRDLSSAERNFVTDTSGVGAEGFTVAYDAIAVIVHPEAADSFFTVAEIRDLVAGKSNKNLIPVFDGLKETSTVRFMLDSVLRGQPLGKNVTAAENSQGVLNYVARTKNAVGFLGISWIGNRDDTLQQSYLSKVRLARMESTDSAGWFVLPVQYLMYTRAYPLMRRLVYILRERHTGLAHGFASFMRQDRGQLLFRRSYLYPAVRQFYLRDTELDKN